MSCSERLTKSANAARFTNSSRVLLHASTSFQNTPILFDETLYVCTPFNRVIALDPETGREKWIFDPKVDLEGLYLVNCRGVSAWTDARAEEGSYCQKRIFTGTIDGRMIALDAPTGRPCTDFGKSGVVDLREGVGDLKPGEYGVTSPPVVLRDRLVTGAMVLDRRAVVEDACPAKQCETPQGYQAAKDGKTLLVVNAVAFAVSALGIGAGTFLLVTAPSARGVSASVSQGGGSIGWLGAF